MRVTIKHTITEEQAKAIASSAFRDCLKTEDTSVWVKHEGTIYMVDVYCQPMRGGFALYVQVEGADTWAAKVSATREELRG